MGSVSYIREQARRDSRRLMTALRAEANRIERETVRTPSDRSREGIAVTDHALVRFLERVMKIDVDAIRRQIARLVPEAAMPRANEVDPDPNGVLLVDGFTFLLSPAAVVTVLDDEMTVPVRVALRDREEFVGASQ